MIEGRILALDLGSKTIGLALSDEMGLIASPHKTIMRRKLQHDLEELQKTVQEWEVKEIVLGIPIALDGTEGPAAQAAREFAKALHAKIPLPQHFWDERFSTAEAERVLIAADLRRKKRREVIDGVAAAIILQAFLDHRRNTNTVNELE